MSVARCRPCWKDKLESPPPSGLAENILRKYATLFGAFTAFTADQGSTHFGRSLYVFTYNRVECGAAANTVTMDSSLGEVRFESTHSGMEMSVVREKFREPHPAEDDAVD